MVVSPASGVYQLYGWKVSPYTQKVAAYLRYKGIAHQEIAPTALQLIRTIQKRVGKAIMPTVCTPDQHWWQDSSEIIDAFEQRFPERSITPSSPCQQIASYLFELHGDEWLVMPALHYRWTIPESAAFAIGEFGDNGLPWAPGVLKKLVGTRVSKMMRRYRPMLGIAGATEPGVESFTRELIERLEQHFRQHDYLLGGRPCLGDFALYGPLWAHLYRDPGSRYLFDTAPHVRAWLARMENPPAQPQGDFLADDEVPVTLTPILQTLFEEQFRFVQSIVQAVAGYADKHPGKTYISRMVGHHAFRIGGIDGERVMLSVTQWKAQRAMDVYAGLPSSVKADVDSWLASINGQALAEPLPQRLERQRYRECLVR